MTNLLPCHDICGLTDICLPQQTMFYSMTSLSSTWKQRQKQLLLYRSVVSSRGLLAGDTWWLRCNRWPLPPNEQLSLLATLSAHLLLPFIYSCLCTCGLSCFSHCTHCCANAFLPEITLNKIIERFIQHTTFKFLIKNSHLELFFILKVMLWVCMYTCVLFYLCDNPPCPFGSAVLWWVCRLLCQWSCPAGTHQWGGAPTLASHPPWFTSSQHRHTTLQKGETKRGTQT